jgi:hypothetical protein
MAIQLNWDTHQKNTLTMTFKGQWSWDEFHNTSLVCFKMIALKEQIIHIVFDMRDGDIPAKSPILHLRYFMLGLPANARQGLITYINNSKYWLIAVATFNRIYPGLVTDSVFVSDLAGAYAAIERKEAQLELLLEDDPEATIASRPMVRLNGVG